MKTIDSLVHARWIIPVGPDDAILEDHSIAIAGSRIDAILPTIEARQHYQADHEINLDRHALIPGLVNAHTHAAMSLFRGLADDLPLMTWLNEHIWPAEQQWISPEFVYDGTLLAAAEMIRGGTTCFNDMYFFPDEAARAATDAGIRASIGMIMIDFPTAWASGPEEYLSKGLELRDRYSQDPLISTLFAPHAPYTVSDAPLQRIQVLSEELDVGIHIHVHETADEISQSTSTHNERPLARLDRLSLLSPQLLAVHMTQLDQEEIALVAERGVHVIHCPESNLKLASGFCPVHALHEAGVNVALGTDGAASNNDLDMFGEMRTAALLAKAVASNASAVPAHMALRMATINGARALGLADVCGSLEPGKFADMVALDLDAIETQPIFHPVSQIVYAASRRQVSDVWINGRRLLKDGRLTTLNEDHMRTLARSWQSRIAAGAGA